MKPKKEIPQIKEEVEDVFNYIAEEITEFLINKNLELIKMIKKEDFESCVVIREALAVFISETSVILNKATNIRRQTLYMHFSQQNDYLREMISKEYLK
jgi:hypothetical protein